MDKKYKVGQEVQVRTRKDPDVWRKAFISSIATCLGYKATLVTFRETDVEVHAVARNIRPVDVSMGTLANVFEIVDGCNGLYVYHLPTNECKVAGDGSEVTVGDLAAFARFDPAGFAEAYGPA